MCSCEILTQPGAIWPPAPNKLRYPSKEHRARSRGCYLSKQRTQRPTLSLKTGVLKTAHVFSTVFHMLMSEKKKQPAMPTSWLLHPDEHFRIIQVKARTSGQTWGFSIKVKESEAYLNFHQHKWYFQPTRIELEATNTSLHTHPDVHAAELSPVSSIGHTHSVCRCCSTNSYLAGRGQELSVRQIIPNDLSDKRGKARGRRGKRTEMENVENSEQIRARGVESWSWASAVAEREGLLGNRNGLIDTLPATFDIFLLHSSHTARAQT